MDHVSAKRVLRCDDDVLSLLVEHGLRVDANTGCFSHCDVMNTGLYSGTGRSIPELAERFITRFATEAPETWTELRRWRLSVEGRCTKGGGCRDGEWQVSAPAGGDSWSAAAPSGETFRADWEVRTSGRRMDVSLDPARELHRECIERFAEGVWQYQYLPASLRTDPNAADALGVMDCFALARWLSERLHRVGVRARFRHGLFLAFMGVEHAWVEIRDTDGIFKPLDPVIAMLAARSAGAPSDFTAFTRGSQLNRVLAWPADTPAILAHVCSGEQRPVILMASAVAAERG